MSGKLSSRKGGPLAGFPWGDDNFLMIRFAALILLALVMPSFAFAEKAWTVMVYMMADNDLEESAVADLDELAAAKVGEACNLVILADRGSIYTSAAAGGLPGWTGAKKLEVAGGRLRELADWGAVDMGKPATIARFVAETTKSHPARRYALFFWDHGGAWTGFGVDESASSGLEIMEIEQGLEDGLNAAGLARLELLGFDACLMSDFDTISHLQSFARFYLASEELEPGHGWDYRALSALEAKPESSAMELGGALIEGFMRQAEAAKNGSRAMLGLVDLGKFGALERAVEAFALAARKDIASFGPGLGRSVGAALAFGKAGSPEQDAHLVDLGSFVTASAAEIPALAPRRDAVLTALKAAVPLLRKGSMLAASTGISIYFPNRAKLFAEDYRTEGHPAWIDFLGAYFDSGLKSRSTTAPPRFVDKDNEGRVEFEEGILYLGGSLAKGGAASVVDAGFSYGILDGGDTILLGDDEAWVDEETGEVYGGWDGTVLILRQGKKETWGYLSLSESEGGEQLYSIPFAYFKNGRLEEEEGDYAYLDLVVDANEEVLSSSLYLESESGMVAELRPVRGSKLVPLVDLVSADGESEQMMTEDWGFDARDWESIEFDFEELESGTPVYLELYVADSTDEGDWIGAETEWP